MVQSRPPGWYPDAAGTTRWWDGVRWTEHTAPAAQLGAGAHPPFASTPGQGAGVQGRPSTSPNGEKGKAALAHGLGAIGFIVPLFGWVGPLVVFLTAQPDEAFTKHHGAESLNFQLTLVIVYLVSAVAVLFCIGFVGLVVAWILNLVMPLVAMTAANRGEWYRYPVNIRMVSGARG